MYNSQHNAITRSIQVLVGLLSTVALLLCAIAYSAQSSTSVKDIYLYKFNVAEIDFQKLYGSSISFNSSLDFATSGLMDVYTIGVSGYCGTSGKTTTCHASRGFTITLQSVIKNEILASPSSSDAHRGMVLAHGIHVPEELVDTSKDGYSARPLNIYYSITFGLVFASIASSATICGVCFHIYPLYGLGVLASVLSGIAILVCASVAQSYGATIGSLSDIDPEWGLQGTLGNRLFYILAWIAVNLQFLVLMMPLSEDKIVSLVDMIYKDNNKHLERGSSMSHTVVDVELGLSGGQKKLGVMLRLGPLPTFNTLVPETVDLGDMIYRCSNANY